MKKLYILFGSPSIEREVSIRSKDYFVNLFKENNPTLIYWTEDNNFVIENNKNDLSKFIEYFKTQPGIVINAVHGNFGEDGYIQEIFEQNGIEFTGSDSKSSMLTINKYDTAYAVKDLVNIIPSYKTLPKEFDYDLCQKIIGNLFPIFAKPESYGSSIGTYKIHNYLELKTILKNVKNIDYLFQPQINGKEISVGCVRDGTKFLDIPITEIIPSSEFFDYNSKYSKNGSKEITPARLSN